MSGSVSAGTVSYPNHRPFITETLVSAGPRKRGTNNTELCEDCIGTCWLGDRLLFWLCDGASEELVLPRLPIMPGEGEMLPAFGFSARILAKEVGHAFALHLGRLLQEGTDIMSGGPFPAEAFAQVAAAWEERLRRYISLEEKRGQLAGLLEHFPQVNLDTECDAEKGITELRTQVWSTTFIGGVFQPSERKLVLWNYGDSGALVWGNQLEIIPPNSNRVMLPVWLETRESLHIRVKALFASSDPFWKCFTEVEGFAVMSDGVVRGKLGDYLQCLQNGSYGNLSELRTALLQSADDFTWDDKAILFARFLEK